MTTPLLDFTRTHTHTHDPETSAEAAEAVAPTASAWCLRILDHIRSRGWSGATHKEIIRHFDGNRSTKRRLSDLVNDGLIVPSGRRREKCNVYVVAENAITKEVKE